MARTEESREDLIREARALVERAEFAFHDFSEPIGIGFRANGAGSIYFGEEIAYHFNSFGELRRAYEEGILYKAEHGRLIALWRERTPAQTKMWRRDLTDVEASEVLTRLHFRIAGLRAGFPTVQVRRQFPTQQNILPRVKCWLEQLARPFSIACTPHVQ